MSKKKNKNYLDLIPVRNEKISYKKEEDSDKIALLIENKGFFNWLFRKTLKKPIISYVHLDEIGSFIRPLTDGSRSVSEIADLPAEQFSDKVSSLCERAAEYFRILRANDFINFRKD